MAEKALTAVLQAQEDVSRALADIADALQDVAEDANFTDDTLQSVSDAADSTRNAAGKLSAGLNKVNEDLSEVSVEAMQAAQQSEDLGSAMDEVSRAQSKLSGTAETTESKLDEEAQTFREAMASADSLAEAKGAASRANTVLSNTARRTEEAVEDEIGAMYRMVQASGTVSEFIDNLRNSNLAAAQAAGVLEENMEDLSVAALSAALPAKFFETVLDDVENSLEEVSDEAQQAAISIAGLGGAFSSTSLNLGPFNFALRRAAVQIPQLVITTGALSTSLLGLASAAGIAGGALAGIFAGGLIAKADRVAASSSDIEGRLEAMEEIAGNVREVFIRALEPLIDGESVAIFEGTLESLAGAVNLLAQVADNLQDELVAAGNEISNAFGDNSTAILREMEDTVEEFLPLIVDLIGYFANHLPNALQFFQDEGVSFTRTLGDFGKQIVGFFKTFTEVGIPILEGAITSIRGVLEAFELVAQAVNTLPDGVLETAFAFLFLSRIFDSVLAKGLSVGMFFSNFGGSVIDDASGALARFNSILGGLQFTGLQRGLGNILQKFGMLKPVVAQSSDAAADAMKEFPELNLPEPGKDVDTDLSEFNDPINSAVSKARNKFSELRNVASRKVSNIPSLLRKKASGIKTALVSPFSSAKESIVKRLNSINQITGSRDIASDVALGGPRLTQDQKPQDMVVDTKTAKARRKLSEFRDSVVRTGGRMRTFASDALSRVRRGFEGLATRGFGAVSVFTGLGEAVVSVVPGLGDFERATNNIRSGLQTVSPELTSVKDRVASVIPSFEAFEDSASKFADSLGERVGPMADAFGEKMDVLADAINNPRAAFDSLSEKVRGKLSGAFEVFDGQANRLADGIDERVAPAVDRFGESAGSLADNLNNPKAAISGFINNQLTALSEAAETVSNSIRSRLSEAVDSFGESAGSFADEVGDTVGPAADRMGEFVGRQADKLNDVSFAGFKSKLSEVKKTVANATIGKAIGVSFEDSGIRDLNTGQFTTLRKAAGSKLRSAVETTLSPIRTLGGHIKNAAGAAREAADGFAESVASVDNYGEAYDLVRAKTDSVKKSIVSLGSGALERVTNGFGRAKTAVGQYAGSLIPANLGTNSLLGSLRKLALAPFKAAGALYAAASALVTQGGSAAFATFNTVALRSALAGIALQGIPVISSVAGMAVSFLGMAAAEGVATAATTALAAALSTIGWTQIVIALTAIVAAAGLMAGALSNVGGVSNAVGGTVNFLKDVLESIFNFLLAIGVPTWNLFIDILEAILAPAFAIKDAFDRLAQGLGLVGDEGTAAGGIMSAIGTAFAALGDAVGFVIGLFQGPFNVIADIIYAAFAIPLGIIVDTILFLVDVIDVLMSAFMNLSIVQNTLSRIQQGIELVQEAFAGLGEIISGSVAFVESMIESMANMVIDALNSIIENANRALPDRFEIDTIGEFEMGDSGGAAGRLSSADASAQQARENAASMTEEDNQNAQQDQAPAQKQETNNYEQNEYNFGDFNMNPEEKARVKGLVQDAISEANRDKRFRDGGN